MLQERNIEIFKNSVQLCRTHAVLRHAIAESIALQQMIPENSRVDPGELNRFADESALVTSGMRTFEAASKYARQGLRTAVLNFASWVNPGGGVVIGASAQEESLCRCSTLYPCLNTENIRDSFYTPHRNSDTPLYNDDCIYTPGVVVFKTDTADPQLMPDSDWFRVNILTCAAPNLRHMNFSDDPFRYSAENLRTVHEKRFGRILQIAAADNNEAIILGAFGCGAFMNDPVIVAEAAKAAVRNYRYAFRFIEFAVYSATENGRNLTIFRQVFG